MGIPLTRQNYLTFTHRDGVPNPLPIEIQTGVQRVTTTTRLYVDSLDWLSVDGKRIFEDNARKIYPRHAADRPRGEILRRPSGKRDP